MTGSLGDAWGMLVQLDGKVATFEDEIYASTMHGEQHAALA